MLSASKGCSTHLGRRVETVRQPQVTMVISWVMWDPVNEKAVSTYSWDLRTLVPLRTGAF